MSVFSGFDWILGGKGWADAPPINQPNKVSNDNVKGQFFIGLNVGGVRGEEDQSGSSVYFSPGNGLKYANVNERSTSLAITRIRSCHYFRTFWIFFVHNFFKYACTSVLQADFHTNTVKYRQVGRSANSTTLYTAP